VRPRDRRFEHLACRADQLRGPFAHHAIAAQLRHRLAQRERELEVLALGREQRVDDRANRLLEW
jgi:hypothetical protein